VQGKLSAIPETSPEWQSTADDKDVLTSSVLASLQMKTAGVGNVLNQTDSCEETHDKDPGLRWRALQRLLRPAMIPASSPCNSTTDEITPSSSPGNSTRGTGNFSHVHTPCGRNEQPMLNWIRPSTMMGLPSLKLKRSPKPSPSRSQDHVSFLHSHACEPVKTNSLHSSDSFCSLVSGGSTVQSAWESEQCFDKGVLPADIDLKVSPYSGELETPLKRQITFEPEVKHCVKGQEACGVVNPNNKDHFEPNTTLVARGSFVPQLRGPVSNPSPCDPPNQAMPNIAQNSEIVTGSPVRSKSCEPQLVPSIQRSSPSPVEQSGQTGVVHANQIPSTTAPKPSPKPVLARRVSPCRSTACSLVKSVENPFTFEA